MVTQKILKLVIITIISTSMATNTLASLVETTIMTTIVPQTSLQQNERYSAISGDLGVFAYGTNGNWNLLELCPYGETTSESRPIQTDIAANGDSFELDQIATDGWLGIEPDIFYDWVAICEYSITPLSIQSLLDDAGFSGTELDEGKFAAQAFCYMNDLFYGLSIFFEDSERIVITYNSEPNISSVAIPEPTTLVLLSFGTLVFIRKRR